MHLYSDLVDWFYFVSPPEEYAEEATVYARLFHEAGANVRTVLELGSGAGCNALHLKRDFTLTLVDLSAEMLSLSRALNPECEHAVGDMRTLRLGRTFDAVFVHDAVMYLTTLKQLRAAMETAFEHLGPGGVALWAPDHVRETFTATTEHGGGDHDGRSLRYLQWTHDPDPHDSTFLVDYAFLLEERGQARVVHDRHVEGLFSRVEWTSALADVGFSSRVIHDAWGRDLFIARKD